MEQRQGLLRRRTAEGDHAVGISIQRSDALGHVTGRTPVLCRPAYPGAADAEDGAQPPSPRPYPQRRHLGGRGDARRRAGADPQGRAGQRLHHPPPDPGGAERRAGARRRQGPLQGRGGGRRRRRIGGDRPRRGGGGEGRLRGAAGGLRRGGGAEAGGAAGQRVSRPQLFHLRGPPLPAHPPRQCREGLRRGRPRHRGALPVVADRACAGGDHRLHRGAGGERPAHLLLQHPGAVLHPRQCRTDPRGAVPAAAG